MKYISRWGPIYWLDLLYYNNGVVNSQESMRNLIPSVSCSGHSLTTNKGNIIIQIPVWKEPKPNGTILKVNLMFLYDLKYGEQK